VGSASRIRIRGVRSLQESPPLFFVDGVRIGSARMGGPTGTGGVLTFLGNLNPRDLDRIEILHASEATTLFGTDAAGGAILIFTRR
jgi:outer membrane cobalamin receptor